MNILILSGSPRKGGNTDLLVQAFAKGASPRHDVEIVSVHDHSVAPCLGCNACFRRDDHKCSQHDDMQTIYDKMGKADMLVIASPVYFYGLSAQLKAVIDRCHNPIRDTFHIKKTALLLVGAASLPELFDGIVSQYQKLIMLSEPQFWFNLNALKRMDGVNLSVGTEVEISNNFVFDNHGNNNKFYAIPTLAAKWTF